MTGGEEEREIKGGRGRKGRREGSGGGKFVEFLFAPADGGITGFGGHPREVPRERS